MTARRVRATTKADMLAWVEVQLATDARLRARVDVQLNRFRLEQGRAARREGDRGDLAVLQPEGDARASGASYAGAPVPRGYRGRLVIQSESCPPTHRALRQARRP
jgi:hypothetical protein